MSVVKMIATHSNPRALVDTNRQISDDMARHIVSTGGVLGLVAHSRFIRPGWTEGNERVSLAEFARCAEHYAALVGWENIGIGSDLDGGFGRTEQVGDAYVWECGARRPQRPRWQGLTGTVEVSQARQERTRIVPNVTGAGSGASGPNVTGEHSRDEAFQRFYVECAKEPDKWSTFRRRFLDVDEATYQREVDAWRGEQEESK